MLRLAAPEVGSSNSRSRLTGETPLVRGAGIDTWKAGWYVEEGPARDALAAMASRTGLRGKLLPEKVVGHRVGWVSVPRASAGFLWAEGHPGDLVGVPGLLSPDVLPEALTALSEALWSEGVPIPAGTAGSDAFGDELHAPVRFGRSGFAGVGRCDATVDLRFAPAEGQAVLMAVNALFREMAGQAETWWQKGSGGRGVETAFLRGFGGKRVLGRWYDKGVQTREAAAGVWVRAEDQRRFDKGSRRDVTELTASYVREKWQRRFLPLYQASKGVTVAGPVVLMTKLGDLIEAGEVKQSEAREVALAMAESLVCGRVELGSRASRYRWRARARGLGLVLGDGLVEDVEIDLHSVIEAALETDAWSRPGGAPRPSWQDRINRDPGARGD